MKDEIRKGYTPSLRSNKYHSVIVTFHFDVSKAYFSVLVTAIFRLRLRQYRSLQLTGAAEAL
jgi:glycerol-3-phosphate acyltransferase PlsY